MLEKIKTSYNPKHIKIAGGIFAALVVVGVIGNIGSSDSENKNSTPTTTAPVTTATPVETTTTAPVETTTTPVETTVVPTTSYVTQEQENNWSEEWEAVIENQINSLFVNDSDETPISYDRDDWGSGWGDEDGDCINTRHEVLILESLITVGLSASGCTVTSGHWYGAFAGNYTYSPSTLDIDHFVPLANAHHSGGWAWSSEKKDAFYNDLSDPQHLIAVSASQNRSKGARGPDEWKPADTSYWCQYAFSWINIKSRWSLSVTSAELEALLFMVESCDNPPNVSGTPSLPPVTTTPPATTTPPVPSNPGNSVNCPDFETWAQAQEWFDTYFPYYGDVGRLDGNNDGVACESLPGAP